MVAQTPLAALQFRLRSISDRGNNNLFIVLGMTLNSSVPLCLGYDIKLISYWLVVQGHAAWRLNCGHACTFGRVDKAVSGGKPPAGKSVVGLLSWHGSHFWVCITFCKVRHGDSVTKPDYYYYHCHNSQEPILVPLGFIIMNPHC